MGTKKQPEPKATGGHFTVELVRLVRQERGASNGQHASGANANEESIKIPPALQDVATLITNAANEFGKHRESLPEEGGRRLMENLFPEEREIEDFIKHLESAADEQRLTEPMSIAEEADFLARKFRRQMHFEEGFLAAVDRYQADLKDSVRYREDMEKVKAGRAKSKAGRQEQAKEGRKLRQKKVYDAVYSVATDEKQKNHTVRAFKNKLSPPGSSEQSSEQKETWSERTIRRVLNELKADGLLDKDNWPTNLPRRS
jgi:hypothetical protein